MKMSNITPFAFGDNLVRSMTDENGNPWFVAKDVAVVLDIQNIRQNLSELDDDEKGVCTTYTPGGAQELKTVSESGLYALVFRSRKPEAKAFSKWVRSEVLPTLRKTGSYIMPGAGKDSRRTMRNSLLLFMGALPEDVQAMRPKLRDRCLNYALQAARLAGVTDMASVYEMFISYCRALYTGGSLQIEQRFSSFVNGEHQLINNYIVNCLTPRRGQNLRFSNIKPSFLRWCQRNGIREVPSDRRLGEILHNYYNQMRSNGTLYLDVTFTEEGLR